MAEFINVNVETEPIQLADNALDRLAEELEAKGIIGWEPNEANLEVILINILAMMANNAALVAAVVPEAVFRQYGTQLFKLLFNEGAYASASTKWKLLEEGGKYPAREIEAGLTIEGSGKAFYVEKAVEVKEGEHEATVQVIAAERGEEYNGITGVLSPVNNINFVSEITITAETTGGADQENDTEYMKRLATQLELQAPRPITAANFATFALDAPSTVLPTGVVIGRATAIDGYNPEVHTFEAKVVSTETTMAEVTSFTGITAEASSPQKHPGTRLKGPGIAEGTTVVSVNEGAKTLVMSKAAISSPGKKEKYEAIGSYENQRTVTVFVTTRQGKEVSKAGREAVQKYLESYREINFKVFVEPPNYNEVRVTAVVHVLSGFNEATTLSNVKTAIENLLSPETWGNPTNRNEDESSGWINATEGFNVVRYNQIIGAIEAVQGVAYVLAGSSGLAIGLEEAPGSKTADLTLFGPAPLPETKPSNIKVTAG